MSVKVHRSTQVKNKVSREPAVIIGALATLIVAVLAIFHIVIDVDTVSAIITAAAPLVASIFIRSKVSPSG